MTVVEQRRADATDRDASEKLKNFRRRLVREVPHRFGTLPNTTTNEPKDRSSAETETAIGRDQGQTQAGSFSAELTLRRINKLADKLQSRSRGSGNREDEFWEPPPAYRVTGLRKWEGRVLDVDEDFFSVAMTPFGGGLEVIADFTRDRLSDEEDLQRGDVVYVTVRTIRDETGPHDTSTIRLRRLGTWTADEVAEQTRRAKDELIEMARYID